MEIERLHQLFLESGKVSTDTRKITKGCMFFALKGENFNGNDFAHTALENGASYVVIDEPVIDAKNAIQVDNVLQTLQELAKYHRQQSKAKIISLTGSNGKTTTKELINKVLSKKYKTIATKGNLNNHIGVPLTLLEIESDTEIAVVEMGANHQGEIAFLSSIALPDFGYITNFGKAHLEGFGRIEGVIKGKSELYDHLMTSNKSIFFNADDPIQKEKLATYISKYGFSESDHKFFNIKLLSSQPTVQLEFEGQNINTQLTGKYNFHNCCAAIIIGKYFNVEAHQITEALEEYLPDNNRSQIKHHGDYTIILDAYNANPTSMKVALDNLDQMEASHKIAFLGDMFELGEHAQKEHQEIADYADGLKLDRIFLVGKHFNTSNSDHLKFEDFEKLATFLQNEHLVAGHILIKGSRGMAMERILDYI